MRETLGLIGLNAGYAAVGLAVLFGAGLVRRPRQALLLAGLALVTGWMLTGAGVALALLAGLPAGISTVLVLWALVTGAGLLAALRVRPAALAAVGEPGWAGRLAGLGFGGLVLAYLGTCLVAVRGLSGAFEPDVTSFWLLKALSLYETGSIGTRAGEFTSFTHPGYPPLLPGSEAVTLHFVGRPDVLSLGTQHWIVAVAFVAAVTGLLSLRVRPAVLLPCISLLAFAPAFRGLVGTSLGDEALLLQFGVAAVLALLWVVERDLRLLALASLFLTACALTKNEGLLLAGTLLASLLVASGRRGVVPVVAAAVAPVGARLLWGLWLSSHHIPAEADYRLSDIFDIGYLGDRTSRLWTGMDGLAAALLGPRWLLVVPLALAACALAAARRPRLVAVAVVASVLVFLGYSAIYWVSPLDIHFYVDSSARRIVSAVGLIGAVALPLLLGETLAGAGRPEPLAAWPASGPAGSAAGRLAGRWRSPASGSSSRAARGSSARR